MNNNDSPNSPGSPPAAVEDRGTWVHRNKKTLVRLDYFAYAGHPKPIFGPRRSVCGVIGTIITLLALFAYMGSSLYRFLTQPPAVSVTQMPTTGHIPFVPTCFMTPNISDPRYFSYQLQRVDTEINSTDKIKWTLPMQVKGRDKICVDPAHAKNLTLRNFCTVGTGCSILKFKLWNCNNSDFNVPPEKRRPQSECANQDGIADILEKNYVQIAYKTELGTSIVNAAPKFSGSSVYYSTFAVNTSTTNPDFLRAFDFWQHDTLVIQSTSYMLQYFFVSRNPKTGKVQQVPTKEVLELVITLGPHKLNTLNTRATSLDLISQWSAFQGVLVGVLGIVFAKYNEKKFYAENPAWEALDENFQVEQGSSSALDAETAKLIAGGSPAPGLNNNPSSQGVPRKTPPCC